MSAASIERPIFLHFINREMLFIRGAKLVPALHVELIKLCGLMSTGCLLAPFAQAHELYHQKRDLSQLVAALAAAGKLILYSGAADFPTFIESRQSLYSGRRDLYKCYFDQTGNGSQNYRTSKALNTTNFIKESLLLAVTGGDRRANIFSREEVDRLLRHANFIKNDFIETQHAATFSLYERQEILPRPKEARFLGQLSTRLFVKHYADCHDAVTPTGVFLDHFIEDYDLFPYFDVELQRCLFSKLGLSDLVANDKFHLEYINLVTDIDFAAFCRKRMQLFKLLKEVAKPDILNPAKAAMAMQPVLHNMSFDGRSVSSPVNPVAMIRKIDDALRHARSKDKRFAAAEEMLEMKMDDTKRILLFTATPLEADVFKAKVLVAGYQFLGVTPFKEFTAASYRKADGVELWHAATSAGSSGLSGSARISEIAMRELNPVFVFSVGIAFGLHRDEQKPGDLLVAETIYAYERAKVENGEYQRRGDIVPCAPEPVSFARHYQMQNNESKVIIGPVFSGDKLVNDSVFAARLRSLESKAVGGEMEGAGIIQACEARRPRFGLFKGIADFGEKKSDHDQHLAAVNAFQFAFDLISAFDRSGTFLD